MEPTLNLPVDPIRTLSKRRAWATAGVATLVMSVSYADRQTLAVLAPTVREALHITREAYGALLAAFSLSYLVGAPFAGALLDRVGARRGLIAAVLVWSVVAAAHALVPGFAMLFLMRIALGFAEAPSFPGATQTIRRVLPPESRSAGFGLLFTGSSIGAMIAPPLAIAVHHHTGSWRLAFVGTALVGLAWLPVWIAITSGPGVRAAMRAPQAEADAITGAAAPLPSRLQLAISAPVLRAMLLVMATSPCIMFCLNWYAQYLADVFALKQDALARYLWVPPIFFDAGAVLFGNLASRADRRAAGVTRTHAPLMLGAAALCAAMVAMPLARDPWSATALAAVALMGGGAVFALVTGDMIARVPPSHASTAGGLTAAAQSLAYVVANPLVGAVVDRTKSYSVLLIILGGSVLPAAAGWALWPVTSGQNGSPSAE